jgi:gliding motility-associated-like protein
MMKCVIKKHLLFFIICLTVFKISAQSVGGTTSPAVTRCAPSGGGFINLTGYTGTILRWESSTDAGTTWTNTNTSAIFYSYGGLLVSTCYRAIIQDGGNPPDSSSVTCITINTPSVGGTITGGGTYCVLPGSGTGTLTLTGITGNVLYWKHSTNGGIAWDTIANTTTSLIYPNITHNTLYVAIVRNGPASSAHGTDTLACPTDTSTRASFIFDSLTVAGTISSSDTACYGLNGKTLNLTGNVGSVLNWLSSTDDGSTWSPITNTTSSKTYSNLIQTTWYTAIVQNGTCSADTSVYAKIIVVQPSPVSAGNDITILKGQSTILNGVGNGTPIWSPSTGLDSINKFKPVATPNNSTLYILSVTDLHTCVGTDTVLVTINSAAFSGLVSNLFTPNGDGINDSWYIQDIQNYPDNEVFVYNIYGNLVYSKKGYTNDWQGTFKGSPLPDGTYYYVLRFDNSDIISKGALDILKNK